MRLLLLILLVGCGKAEAPVDGGPAVAGVGDEFEEDLGPREPLDDAPKTGPDGAYLDSHSSGEPRTRGAFEGGLRTGIWERLDPNGTVLVSGRFEAGKATGTWHWRWPDGSKQQQGDYVAGLASGAWFVWRADGSLFEEMTHAKGHPDGPWRIFHPGGQVAEVMTWRAGLQEGEQVDWSPSGARWAEGSFVRSKPVGTWTCFDRELPRTIPAPAKRMTPAEACGFPPVED